MSNYYAEKLNSMKLFQVYDTKIDRVKQYFREELNFVRRDLHGYERVLELGCGYGRIMKELAPNVGTLVGIDISPDSVRLGEEYLKDCPNCEIKVMDAHNLQFDEPFDIVLCLQNGISALKGKEKNLIDQSLKVLVPGGKAYFSTYSAKFWNHRVAWFQEQADKGLLGELDMEKTKNGHIECKDGFVANTYTFEDFQRFAEESGCRYKIEEVDESSLFLVLQK
ncbi:MAG: class I SAM-dependent methyltransferase [Aminobacterium sp.]|jgi:SAM-dependent methyltransferase|uniref:class I SAM-dependent methyltransferase n=1 Tax=Aminobacterium sp. TaxID=1872491 RepID=UPI001BCC9FA2|nr:methyltransferase domain-containing protein [Aminobacterium sp.]MDD2206972.1 class I SAM-dependent methyltransferase [Aminobacterium sp.]MDD3707276.1 class I SAM-dependent methyltransferase [Aminobacterium sp.]MDD4228558.1 class I SAM-dependent methyltransferase [Aminobacterium sp.]MDD4551466.1 class I SAM-dependent methyltransferase [Aminobacterium sp.]MEA4876633.1 class I SAM-dependent methyltransferase [Aminobacterium sp.]